MNLDKLKKTIDKLEDVNENFKCAGKEYKRIDEVLSELKAYYKEEKKMIEFYNRGE